RITRSPGAVVRIIRTAASISSAPPTSRTLPPGVSTTGKLHPEPIKSPLMSSPLVEPDRLAGGLELGLGRDLDLRRLDDQLLARLDLDGGRVDRQLLLAGQPGLVLLQVQRGGGVTEGQVHRALRLVGEAHPVVLPAGQPPSLGLPAVDHVVRL